jgi:WD40 repeat protein
VVKAGRPESSQLYRAMAHLDGAKAMPPASPKLPEEKLALVREWIRGGLIEGKGGTSQLRNVAAMLAAAPPGTPAPLPESLPKVAPSRTVRPPIPQAMAASPGAPLLAVSGHEQVLLFRAEEKRNEKGAEIHAPSTPSLLNSSSLLVSFLGALPFPEGTLHDLKFSRNGTLLLAAGGRGAHSGRVVLFDMKTGERVAEIGDEVDSVLAADVSADHQYVALGGPSKIVKVFSTKTGELIHRITKHTDWITAAAFNPDGKLFATGDRSGGVHVWETEKGAIVFTLDEHKVRVTDLSWRADGAVLASAAEDGNLILWSMKDGFPLRNIVAHASSAAPRYSRRTGVLSLDSANDGRLLTSGRDGTIRLWSANGEQDLEFRTDSGLPVTATFLNRSAAAVVGTFDGSLHVFDLPSQSHTQVLPPPDDNPVP